MYMYSIMMYLYDLCFQIFFLLFILLYVSSYVVISWFKKRTDSEECITG